MKKRAQGFNTAAHCALPSDIYMHVCIYIYIYIYIFIYIYIYMGEVLEKRTIQHFHSFSGLHGYRVKTCIPI